MKKIMKKTVLALFVAVSALVISFAWTGKTVIAQEQGVWIDVRTQAEWDSGHLSNAVLIPYDQISQKISTVVTDKKQPINLYCRSGRRAEIALRTLEQLGYTSVQNLGSFEALKASGLQ